MCEVKPRENSDTAASERLQLAALVALMGACAGGMGLVGWLGGPWPVAVALVCAALGAAAAAFIEASTLRDRILSFAPSLLGAMTGVAATARYMSGRSSIMKVELLVPMGIALVVAAIARFVVERASGSSAGRWTSAQLGVLGAVFALSIGVAVATHAPLSEMSVEAERAPEQQLTLDLSATGTLQYRGQSMDTEQLRGLLKTVADTAPATKVQLRVPKGMDQAAGAAKVLPLALPLGLRFETVQAE